VIVMKIVWTAAWLAAVAAPALAGVYEDRERDWRNGAIVYQVIVDRFVPSANSGRQACAVPGTQGAAALG
jgi:hypothetical protein